VHVFGYLTFPRPYWERLKHCAVSNAQNCEMNGNTKCCISDIRIQKDVLTVLFVQVISANAFDIFLSLLLNEVGKDPPPQYAEKKITFSDINSVQLKNFH
jgi:hypothetical protein